MKPRFVQIGSFNIEQFGKGDERIENQRALAGYIESSGVDVLALQGLYATNDLTLDDAMPRNGFLDAALTHVRDHTGDPWEYEIYRNRDWRDTTGLWASTSYPTTMTMSSRFSVSPFPRTTT